MCGRFVLATPVNRLVEYFGIDDVETAARTYAPSWNIPPTQLILGITAKDSRHLGPFHWGLIPAWASDRSIASHTFNARAETLTEKPSFSAAFEHRRMIVPADAFYEWGKTGRMKGPHAFRRDDGNPMAFAGLWESWVDPDTGEVVQSCSVITVAAGKDMLPVHSRSPLILESTDWSRWLDEGTNKADVLAIVHQPSSVQLVRHRVDDRVGSPLHNDPQLLVPVGETTTANDQLRLPI